MTCIYIVSLLYSKSKTLRNPQLRLGAPSSLSRSWETESRKGCAGWQCLGGDTGMKHEKRMAPTLLSDGCSVLVIAVSELVSAAYQGMSICVPNSAVCCSSGTFVRSLERKVPLPQ